MTTALTSPAAADLPTAERLLDSDPSELDRLLRREFSPRETLDGDQLDKMLRLAEQMATARISVPEHLRGNVGDCLAIVTQAMLWNMNPFAVAQKTHVVNGRLGYEAQLVHAVVQSSGAIRGSFNYEYRGDGANIECRVGAVLRGDSEITWGEWYSAASATTKNSPLWKTNPKQQLGYLQVKNWARAFAPGAILGVYTRDELEEVEPAAPAAPRGPQRRSEQPSSAPATSAPASAEPASAPPAPKQAPAPTTNGITTGQTAYLRNKLKAAGIEESAICAKYEIGSLVELSLDAFDAERAELIRGAS